MSVISAFPQSQISKILEACHHDPFEVLGHHKKGKDDVFCVFQPRAKEVTLEGGHSMLRYRDTDLFLWRGLWSELWRNKNAKGDQLPKHYTISWIDDVGNSHQHIDPYSFGPQLSDFDMHLFAEGTHLHAYRFLGANPKTVDGIDGVLFATWAPSAQRVSVVGEFNDWDGRCHSMRVRGSSGIWELFLPNISVGTHYKLEIRDQNGHLHLKADPYGRASELRPATASRITADSDYHWSDTNWQNYHQQRDWLHTPLSIYELHLSSWQRDDNGDFLDYRTLAHRLVDHAHHMGFTHIQLLPVTEHPLDASWGYQTTGYFAPTSRFGTPDDFRYFVDHCHQNGIGVLMDWVPAHFPKDAHGLARFDGSALYEHEDPRRGEHQDWGTLIYNYGRNEVKSFLISSAIYWLEEFHIDGLRVDAVASMLYLDYSRDDGQWLPNIYGGNENLEAIDFLRHMNTVIHEHHPGCLTIAEESTSWPQVSRPTWLGGLGFSMKWNMGWMHDTLNYFNKDPIHRHYHHQQLTFGLLYAFTENFVLPFSHDEVVHGKGSLLGKMPGDGWQQFANLRLLYTYMYTYPGKKLLFMGCEFGQGREWDFDAELDWHVLDDPQHRGVMDLLRDLNHLYRDTPALHQFDFDAQGFEWIDCNDAAQSTISYLRKSDNSFVVVILNFTPVVRENYRIGLPMGGNYRELMNSDSEFYGGSNVGNGSPIVAEEQTWMNRPYSVELTLPPLGALILTPA